MLKIFNTLTRKKEHFRPIKSGHVSIYVCGATVYDLCHIGHARTFLFFDFVVRYLQYSGYTVNYVRNITDIDDKIIQRAFMNKESYQKLTNRMIVAMQNDLTALNVIPPNYEPRVTEYMNDIIAFISKLIDKNYAYIASNGDVLFSLKKAKNYNVLSGQNLEKMYIMKSSNVSFKRHPMDFVLWKKCNSNNNSLLLSDSVWFSPWGNGRPGWHIECSVMSYVLLGKHFDIHGGGIDLIFPHHENEIVQSTAAYDTPYANIWMHVGMVKRNSMKMSKSLKNFFTIRDVLQNYDPETVRYFLMSAHYRNSINYTNENIRQSRLSLEHLYMSLRNIDKINSTIGEDYFISKFISEIDNDFNMPGAYSVLFEISHKINQLKSKGNKYITELQNLASTLRYLGQLLGLLNQNPDCFLKRIFKPSVIKDQDLIQEIELLVKNRNIARKNKNWILADQLRCALYELGVILEDDSQGSTMWRFIS
ncbi:cysteine--tRNA ligase [Blochmannia endosymbiont of Polyrhachis (Hedomyrma) turneri]|uniref:cysteine--tRNA ligase n=1 Tax=Blochmannia endosymbiont of Polyrhachis (Hedomyrma) turneri TaxID=1505596 RepID=UPI00061A7662|nr:cysteine--tRNA ligase [Blochmannia endosymbiont of Polyrhachis (Hedomyrma) turneri]AKC59876.1 Cysteine--tRNA ligase [Blochmannia endosymbiont of Polyrhachis (Hedomyrma) turneri]